jgi:alpha-beta hydrolase superfamily lysophospholipase
MHAFERGALRFAVIDSGPSDAEVVILLHWFPQQPRRFTRVAERLNAAGLRTLIPSQRGYTPTAGAGAISLATPDPRSPSSSTNR